MKALLWMAMTIGLFSDLCFSQVNFSDETKKCFDYNDPVTVFKNALLIDGKGNPARPHQMNLNMLVVQFRQYLC
jgi:hypothetical protein